MTDFSTPERVALRGYSGDAMEPFLSPDGRFLFFNNLNAPSVDTNLHYAERVDALTFDYRGEVLGVNSPSLDAVASMDQNGDFVFVSTRSYQESLSTLYWGKFASGTVSGVSIISGVSRMETGWLNFDAGISPDGQTLYFADGHFASGGIPDSADLVVAARSGSGFQRLPNSADILRNVNSNALEYAPAISADGLDLFFTRLESASGEPAIFVARRANTSQSFGTPQKISAITGFVEAPTLSADGRSLYYHKREGSTFVLYRVTRN